MKKHLAVASLLVGMSLTACSAGGMSAAEDVTASVSSSSDSQPSQAAAAPAPTPAAAATGEAGEEDLSVAGSADEASVASNDALGSQDGLAVDTRKLTRARSVFVKNQRIRADYYRTLRVDANTLSVASGADVISGTLSIELSGAQSSTPPIFQIRPVIVTVTGGTTTVRSNGPHQIMVVGGHAFAQVPVPPVDLGANERLRFQVKGLSNESGYVVSATYRGQHLQ